MAGWALRITDGEDREAQRQKLAGMVVDVWLSLDECDFRVEVVAKLRI